jgi:diketogulonate reductase-like aldo/keto reductase
MIELSDGLSIPRVGLCAFRKDSIQEMKEIVKESVKNGFRYFEIAELFCNGHVIMEALSETGLSRTDVFIALKLWPKDKTPDALVETCKQLIYINKFEYIDLIIIHAPIDVENRFEQWKALEQLKREQLVNSLGAANITINHLMTILKDYDIAPSVFQVQSSVSISRFSLAFYT